MTAVLGATCQLATSRRPCSSAARLFLRRLKNLDVKRCGVVQGDALDARALARATTWSPPCTASAVDLHQPDARRCRGHIRPQL
jgi:hypothetical protein